MKAVAISRKLPLDHPEAFTVLDLPVPEPGPRDLLVRVRAVSVNPLDCKRRLARSEGDTEPQVLGWDAAGIVEATGSEVTLFRVGEEVYYAGDLNRPGSNAEYQLVDERIVARKPQSFDFEAAAALPLVSITAWETLFDRLALKAGDMKQGRDKVLLILGGAGGVGSIAIQLAAALTGFTVVATASRPESVEWCHSMGAHHVVDHSGDWPAELEKLGIGEVDCIACFADPGLHWEAMARAIRPQGKICAIVLPAQPPDLGLLRPKSVTFTWEFMFTRSMFQTPDMIAQHELLAEVSQLVDAGHIRSILRDRGGDLAPATLAAAHQALETGRTIGKRVLTVP